MIANFHFNPKTGGMKYRGLMVASLLVMVGLLLVREFVPEGPIAIAALVAGGIIALAIIVPDFIIALFRSRSDNRTSCESDRKASDANYGRHDG